MVICGSIFSTVVSPAATPRAQGFVHEFRYSLRNPHLGAQTGGHAWPLSLDAWEHVERLLHGREMTAAGSLLGKPDGQLH
ncbi:MAG: hypothetical protein DMG38_23615 [Acidobacteria bacterium]|nr:MAG: hypothetical protein DMG38_23615 [Acidobacteriota bacterium]